MRKPVIISLILALLLLLCACGKAEAPALQTVEEAPAPAQAADAVPLLISEVMPKNKATFLDGNGEFKDWVEIFNPLADAVSLDGWQISTNRKTISLDGDIINPGEYRLYSIAIKEDETVYLRDGYARDVDCCPVTDDTADFSFIRDGEGFWIQSRYPTPGRENTSAAFEALQEERVCSGPLAISEVSVENFRYFQTNIGYTDYVEIENISDESVNAAGWGLSDDDGNFFLYVFPDVWLEPGEKTTVLCDKDAAAIQGYKTAPFSLDSESDRVYLTSPEGVLVDYTPLRDIPYGMTYGRIRGENGFFYMAGQTPGRDNDEFGYARRIAVSPLALTKDGVFNNTKAVTVELQGDEIYYTTDGTIPTKDSLRYTGPFPVDETCIVRAVCAEEGALNSRALTLSYIINEDDSLPVVSVVADDPSQFRNMYESGIKDLEIPGVISYYGDDGCFTIGAGIKMHGFSTLNLPKKNLSFRFRGCYGDKELNYRVFGDEGPSSFKNLLLRAGGDQTNTIVKNEVCLNLAKEFTDSVVISCNRYVAVYLNGSFRGIYSLMEKNNEQQYADLMGVSRDSVTLCEEPCYDGSPFFEEVLRPVFYENIEEPGNYEKLCEVLDIDSLIDWTIIEGFYGNWDLQSGNIRYVKSTEGDGKWRVVLYDLDNALWSAENCFDYVLRYTNQVSALNERLLKIPDYRSRFIDRASEALKNEMTAGRVWEEFEKEAAVIDGEAKKDTTISYNSWQSHLDDTKDTMLEDYDWYNTCGKKLGYYLKMNSDEQRKAFGALR